MNVSCVFEFWLVAGCVLRSSRAQPVAMAISLSAQPRVQRQALMYLADPSWGFATYWMDYPEHNNFVLEWAYQHGMAEQDVKNLITGDVWTVDLKQLVQCSRAGRERPVRRVLLLPDTAWRSRM